MGWGVACRVSLKEGLTIGAYFFAVSPANGVVRADTPGPWPDDSPSSGSILPLHAPPSIVMPGVAVAANSRMCERVRVPNRRLFYAATSQATALLYLSEAAQHYAWGVKGEPVSLWVPKDRP
jgi:hypothetical protein